LTRSSASLAVNDTANRLAVHRESELHETTYG